MFTLVTTNRIEPKKVNYNHYNYSQLCTPRVVVGQVLGHSYMPHVGRFVTCYVSNCNLMCASAKNFKTSNVRVTYYSRKDEELIGLSPIASRDMQRGQQCYVRNILWNIFSLALHCYGFE